MGKTFWKRNKQTPSPPKSNLFVWATPTFMQPLGVFRPAALLQASPTCKQPWQKFTSFTDKQRVACKREGGLMWKTALNEPAPSPAAQAVWVRRLTWEPWNGARDWGERIGVCAKPWWLNPQTPPPSRKIPARKNSCQTDTSKKVPKELSWTGRNLSPRANTTENKLKQMPLCNTLNLNKQGRYDDVWFFEVKIKG